MSDGLVGFQKLLREMTRLSGWVLPTAGISPVVASLAGLNPPWPTTVPVTVATSMAVLVMLVAIFQFLDGKSKRQVDRVMWTSLLAGGVFAFAYFTLFALFTYQTPVTNDTFVKGFQCSADALKLYADKCPWLDLDELKAAEYEASRLWTIQSVIAARLSLLFGWFAMFCSFSVYLGAFLRHQMMKGKRHKSAAKPRIDASAP